MEVSSKLHEATHVWNVDLGLSPVIHGYTRIKKNPGKTGVFETFALLFQ
jgi:hypothetical protein